MRSPTTPGNWIRRILATVAIGTAVMLGAACSRPQAPEPHDALPRTTSFAEAAARVLGGRYVGSTVPTGRPIASSTLTMRSGSPDAREGLALLLAAESRFATLTPVEVRISSDDEDPPYTWRWNPTSELLRSRVDYTLGNREIQVASRESTPGAAHLTRHLMLVWEDASVGAISDFASGRVALPPHFLVVGPTQRAGFRSAVKSAFPMSVGSGWLSATRLSGGQDYPIVATVTLPAPGNDRRAFALLATVHRLIPGIAIQLAETDPVGTGSIHERRWVWNAPGTLTRGGVAATGTIEVWDGTRSRTADEWGWGSLGWAEGMTPGAVDAVASGVRPAPKFHR